MPTGTTVRTDSFQTKLAVENKKTGREIENAWNNGLVETNGASAIGAGKMGVALVGFAVAGQFEMANAVF